MNKNILTFLVLVASLTLLSNKMYSQQDSIKMPTQSEQINNQKALDDAKIQNLKDDNNAAQEVANTAKETERDAVASSKQSKSALKAEKKAQKSRKKADEQIKKAEKAKIKSDKNQ